jgi:anti-sigma factor RsiW
MVVETVRRDCPAGYDEGALRAYLDGEIDREGSEALQAHAKTCDACSERLMRLRLDGALVQGRLQLLEADAARAVCPRPAVASLLAAAKQAQRTPWLDAVHAALAGLRASAWRPGPLAAGAAAGAVLLVGVAATQPAVQSFAQGVIQSLRVQKVQPVKLDLQQLSGGRMPGIDELLSAGTYTGPREPSIRSASVADAARTTGLALRAPAKLPAQVPTSHTTWISDPVNFTFIYDGQRLVTLAQEYGVTDAALLADLRALNGATVKGNVPAAAAMFYGDVGPAGQQAAAARDAARKNLAEATEAARKTGNTQPFLALIQLKAPSLDVPGNVNVDRIRQGVLRSGAVPPAVAAQLLAFQDWKTTLPVPVIKGTSEQVTVDGVAGTLIEGEGPDPVLFWQKDGVLYVMSTSGTKQQLLAAAGSLSAAK